MAGIHLGIANAMVLYFAIVGLWGVVEGIRNVPLSSSYRGALVLAEGVGVLQGLVGLVLLVLGLSGQSGMPRDYLHFLYGLSVVVTLPLVRQYISGRRVRQPLAYGLACLFMMGLAIRGITTGR